MAHPTQSWRTLLTLVMDAKFNTSHLPTRVLTTSGEIFGTLLLSSLFTILMIFMNTEYIQVPCRTFSLWLPNGGRRIVNQIQTEEWPDLAAPEGPRWHILKLSSNLKNQGFLSTSSTGLRTFRQWPMLRLKVLRSVMGLKALDFNQFLLQRPLARSERGPGPCLCIAVQVYQDFTIIKILAFGNNGITMATESCQP